MKDNNVTIGAIGLTDRQILQFKNILVVLQQHTSKWLWTDNQSTVILIGGNSTINKSGVLHPNSQQLFVPVVADGASVNNYDLCLSYPFKSDEVIRLIKQVEALLSKRQHHTRSILVKSPKPLSIYQWLDQNKYTNDFTLCGQNLGIIHVCSSRGMVYMQTKFIEEQTKLIAALHNDENSFVTDALSKTDNIEFDSIPLSHFLWLIGIAAYQRQYLVGAFNAGLLRLSSWPDFSIAPHDQYSIKLFSLLINNAFSLRQLIKITGMQADAIQQLLIACQFSGLLVAEQRQSTKPEKLVATTNRSLGWLSHIRNALGMSIDRSHAA